MVSHDFNNQSPDEVLNRVIPALVRATSRRHLSRDAEKPVAHGRRCIVGRGGLHFEPQTVDHQVGDQLEFLVVGLPICLYFLSENLGEDVVFHILRR